jgi:hypothetical protein
MNNSTDTVHASSMNRHQSFNGRRMLGHVGQHESLLNLRIVGTLTLCQSWNYLCVCVCVKYQKLHAQARPMQCRDIHV